LKPRKSEKKKHQPPAGGGQRRKRKKTKKKKKKQTTGGHGREKENHLATRLQRHQRILSLNRNITFSQLAKMLIPPAGNRCQLFQLEEKFV
jgi:hypothetical protein